MTDPSKPSKSKQWDSILKGKIKQLNESDDLQVEVLPPSNPPPKRQSSIDFFLRKKQQKQVQPINIDAHAPYKGISRFPQTIKPSPAKASIPLTGHLKQERRKPEVIDLLKDQQKVQKRKEPAIDWNQAMRRQKAFRKQMQIVEDMNRPAWQVHKEERRVINAEKYPRSQRVFTDMHINMHSGQERKYPRKELHSIGMHSEKEKKQLRKEEKKKQSQGIIVEQDYLEQFNLLAGISGVSSKMAILNQQEEEKQRRLLNQQVHRNLQGNRKEEMYDQWGNSNKKSYHPGLGLHRGGQPEANATQLVNTILQHNYAKKHQQREVMRIPERFKNEDTYKTIFHYLITNESKADVEQRLKTLEEEAPEPIKIKIRDTVKERDGLVRLYIDEVPEVKQQEGNEEQKDEKDEKEKEKEGFKLKNLSLSKNRIGLICSSREYRKDYFGVPERGGKDFAFLALLITPETKEEMRREVKCLSAIKDVELELCLRRRKSRKAYFFDLEKLSTQLRQYMAVTNIPYSLLADIIFEPEILEKELGMLVPHRQVLEPILNLLRDIYNPTQWQSIKDMVYRQKGFVLLQGPPGTGKTSTLMGLLSAQYEYLRKVGDSRKILICAPSNAAVDHITRRLADEGLINGEGETVRPKIIRAGIVETQDQAIREVSLDYLCEKIVLDNNEAARKISQMTTAEMKDRMMVLEKELKKRGITEEESKAKRQQLKMLQNSLFSFRKEKQLISSKQYEDIEKKIVNDAEIVLTTLASSGNDRLLNKIRGQLACLIVDQAAQATEPTLLIALQTGVSKVLLIGDPCQLPSTCISSDANVTLFNRSLFERFLEAGIKPYFLNIQYRMAPLIRQFPSSAFYQKRLNDADSIANRPFPHFLQHFKTRSTIFVDIGYGEQRKRGESYTNDGETKMVGMLIRCLLSDQLSLGVITPYQAQRRAIVRDCQQNLKKEEELMLLEKTVMINTVDSFQGQEKDVIIVSTVRSNPRGNVGFLTDDRRINVALTRARFLLIVVGNGDTLGGNSTWNDFLTWAEKMKVYYQISNPFAVKEVTEQFLKDFNQVPVNRKLYEEMTYDVRKKQRMQTKKRDLQAIPRARRETHHQMEEEPEYYGEKKESRYEKGALCQEQVAEIMQKKAKMAEQQARAEQIVRRVEQLSTEQKYKNDPRYSYLFD